MIASAYTLADLLRLMERLRDPETGCPWDLDQDFHSIVPSTLEECYELAQAIADNDHDHIAEELGDVLFQVIFYAQLGKEGGLFSFEGIVNTLVEKLIRRHPHVFANGDLEGVVDASVTMDDVQHSWESIKQEERDKKRLSGLMADVPLALPALSRAQKLQKRAARVAFDWRDATAVLDKVEEEIGELREAIAAGENAGVHDEMGDVLFTCVNLARHLGQDAEESLRHSCDKFLYRFQQMEEMARADGNTLPGMSAAQLDDLWRQVKA